MYRSYDCTEDKAKINMVLILEFLHYPMEAGNYFFLHC